MRQRNDTDYPLTVGTDPVVLLQPGQTIDHEHPVAGLTAVEPAAALPSDPPAPQPVPAPTAAKAAPAPAEEATR